MRVLGSRGEKGWMTRFIGTEISEETWEKFTRAGDKRRKRNLERLNEGTLSRKPRNNRVNWNEVAPQKRQKPTNETFNVIPKAEKEKYYA